MFYVTTSEVYRNLFDFNGFGVLTTAPTLVGSTPYVASLVLSLPPIPPSPVAIGSAARQVTNGANIAPVQGLLAQSSTIRTALGSSPAVSFEGCQIYPSGSLAIALKNTRNS